MAIQPHGLIAPPGLQGLITPMIGSDQLSPDVLQAVVHRVDEARRFVLCIWDRPTDRVESSSNGGGCEHSHASAIANDVGEVFLHKSTSAPGILHDSKMLIALCERHCNGYLVAARRASNPINGLHHAIVVVHKLRDIAGVDVARVDQQNHGRGVVNMIDQHVGLLVTSTFDEGAAEDFTRIVQQHHGGVLALPTHIDTAAERAGRRSRPAAGLQLVDHVHAGLVQGPIQGPHVKRLLPPPCLFVQPCEKDRLASLTAAEEENPISRGVGLQLGSIGHMRVGGHIGLRGVTPARGVYQAYSPRGRDAV